ELPGKQKTFAKDRRQHLDILWARDASQQDEVRVRPNTQRQIVSVAFKRASIASVVGVNGDFGKSPQIIESDRFVRSEQSAVGSDHHCAWRSLRRTRKSSRIRYLAPKIEAAQESEDLAQRRGLSSLKTEGQRKSAAPT